MSKEADEIKGLYFPCLDHGFVALVDYMGDDDAVVQAARVSYGAGTKKVSNDRGLIRYLMRHRHTTPFEMVELKFHVKLPIFVARQLVRHRTASLNEYSLRYSLPAMLFYMPEYENVGKQSKKNRQGRAENLNPDHYNKARVKWHELQQEASELYEAFINPDVDMARELARMHLPLSLYTEWYWKMDLHNLFHFLSLRCDSHAQWEIRQFANLKAAMVKRVAPIAFEAWVDYVYSGTHFSFQEMEVLRHLLGVSGESPNRVLDTLDTYGPTEPDMKENYDISQREIDEFFKKFDTPELFVDGSPFELDLSQAKSPQHFLEKAQETIPKGA